MKTQEAMEAAESTSDLHVVNTVPCQYQDEGGHCSHLRAPRSFLTVWKAVDRVATSTHSMSTLQVLSFLLLQLTCMDLRTAIASHLSQVYTY